MGILVGQSMNCPSVTHCIPLGSDLFLIHFLFNFKLLLPRYAENAIKILLLPLFNEENNLLGNSDDETEIHRQDHLLIIGYLNNLRTNWRIK